MTTSDNWITGPQIMEHINYLSESLGRRLAGSEAERQAAAYVAEQFESMGLENVALQSFPIQAWEPQSAHLQLLEPQIREIDIIPVAHAPATTPEGIEADIVYVETASAAHLAGKNLAGKIGLVLGIDLSTPEWFTQLQQTGVAAALFIDERYLFDWPIAMGVPASYAELLEIPMASISYMDAWEIVKLAAPRARLVIQVKIEAGKSQNVIAELPGQGEEVIVLTAHLDSVARGLGAGDDASGVACLLEVARNLVNAHRDRTLRFIITGAEEQLSEGARYYVWNADDLPAIQCNINLDSIGTWLGENHVSYTGPQSLLEYLESKLAAVGFIALVKSLVSPYFDSFPFGVAGMPTVTFHRENPSGGRICHHSSLDTPAVLSPDQLAATARAARAITADLAQGQMPFDRIIPESYTQELRGYAEKMFNLPGGQLPN